MNTDQLTRLANDTLSIAVHAHGAELWSIRLGETEYLWQADPAFWKRHSPVLFPIVGSLAGSAYRVDGVEHPMSQHGFARDMDFELIAKTDTEVWYRLVSSDETLAKFPYPFRLEIGYRVEHKAVRVMWRIENPSDKRLDFQIGAHPAFYFRGRAKDGVKGYFSFDNSYALRYRLIGRNSCADVAHDYLAATDQKRMLPITADTFSRDALIFEEGQIRSVTLHDADRKPYLRMRFSAPLVGLWAPSAESPFVCIEPWYGRCDREDYAGEFADRDWMRHLDPHAKFEADYTIEVLE